MRYRILAVVLALVAVAPAAAAASSPTGVTTKLSTRLPGARHVVLTVGFRSILECGRLQARSIQLHLPREMHVPARIARSAVLVSGQPASSVHVTGTVITIGVPHPMVTCFTMAPGTVTVRIGRAAALRNPTAKGPYDLAVVVGMRAWLGTFSIT